MRRHGLSARVLPGGLSEEDGAAAADALLTSQPRPTAVLAFNDQCATGVLDVFLAPASPSRARSPWSASTTVTSPGWPTST